MTAVFELDETRMCNLLGNETRSISMKRGRSSAAAISGDGLRILRKHSPAQYRDRVPVGRKPPERYAGIAAEFLRLKVEVT
jgi:hypothetical protein